jgi:hypothetical protein
MGLEALCPRKRALAKKRLAVGFPTPTNLCVLETLIAAYDFGKGQLRLASLLDRAPLIP